MRGLARASRGAGFLKDLDDVADDRLDELFIVAFSHDAD
jgi:hypothetical protein